MPDTTRIHFVRHGAVENPRDIFYGRLPGYPLSALGRKQVEKIRGFFQDRSIAAIYSSPLLRARQTARLLTGNAEKSRVSVSNLLTESKTPFDGSPIQALNDRRWDLYSGTGPPYEQPKDVFQRSFRFIHRMNQRYRGAELVAVTHADVIVFIVLWALGYEVNYAHKALIEQKKIPIPFPQPASITTLGIDPQSEHPTIIFQER